MSNPESNYYYSQDVNMNNYFNTINNYIDTINNSINYLNRSNEIISNMYNNLDYYYYYNWNNYNTYNNNPNYVQLENNRRRRVSNEEMNFENSQQVNHTEPRVESQEETSEEIINNHYRELSRQNLINAIATNITKIKFRDLPNPTDTMCAITQEDFEQDDDVGIIDNCGHIFKYDSLLNWLIRHQSCPNCRHSILIDTNLIRYTDTETNERLYLTNSQFRRHVLRRVFVNNNQDSSSNVLSVSFR